MISFNIPLILGTEHQLVREAIQLKKLCGDGSFTKQSNQWLESYYGAPKVLLTTSCTHALEMAAILADIKPGDEVIMPSYTFVSTANAFALRGAKIVFADIDPASMNLDVDAVEAAISAKTRAIVPVHYAGISCDMDNILQLAERYQLVVIEDAAQALQSYQDDIPVGKRGHMSCISFHETKNIHCGEGGALVINDGRFADRAEIIREKGTNRSRFLRGQVDKYTWVDLGSSYLPSELNAAFLLTQLKASEEVTAKRLTLWNTYATALKDLENDGLLECMKIPAGARQNAHMFYIKLNDLKQRQALIGYLKSQDVQSAFHYVPLHSSVAGLRFGVFSGSDRYTTKESERLLRLPMHLELQQNTVIRVAERISNFLKQS